MGRRRRFAPRKNVLEIKHYEKIVRELWIRSQNGDYRCEFRLQNCPSYHGDQHGFNLDRYTRVVQG